MPTLLPLDDDSHPISAMRLRPGGAHTITAAATSARNTAAFDADTRIVSLYASVPVYIRFGGGRTGHYTHLAVLRAGGTDGPVYISEKE